MMQKRIRKPKVVFWLLPLVLIFAIWSLLNLGNKRAKSLEGFDLPEGFIIEEATSPGLVQFPMFAVFDDLGNLFVFESSGHTESTEAILESPDFKILLLEDSDNDGVFDDRTVFAEGLPFPMGGVFLNGSLIVTAAPDLLKLTDTNGDGKADKKEILLSGWTLNHNGALLSGPFLGPDGWLYLADARRGFDILSKEFVHFQGAGARIWRCLPDGSQLQSFASGGFDNAIELAFTPSGEVLGTMTYFMDPQAGYRDALMHWVQGGVYPKQHAVIEQDEMVRTGPLMPVMHKMARVSPSGLMRYEGSTWGSHYESSLFHTEFNTGKVIQTRLTEVGASFKAESNHFLTSQREDFHPTDVLQDGEGNLILVNTGGWFIAGCPLSRVAKTDVKGGIYKISKGKSTLKDPWGKTLDWENFSIPQLIGLLEDPRQKVSRKAEEMLLNNPIMAIPYLKNLLQNHPEEKVRTRALFLLFRTQSPMAWNQMYLGLKDPSPLVRAAAAKALGNAVVNTAVDDLIGVLADESLAVCSQAVTALGQIRDSKATQPLLDLLKEKPYDRYLEHAVIFALIHMDNEALLQANLNDPSLQKAIMIALDQKGSAKVNREILRSLLLDEHSPNQSTAAWILGRHPDEYELFIEKFLLDLKKDEGLANDQFAPLFAQFIDHKEVQLVWINAMNQNSLDREKKKALIHLLGEHPPEGEFPSGMQEVLENLLKTDTSRIREEIVDLVLKLELKGFDPHIKNLLEEEQTEPMLRMKAMQVQLADNSKIKETAFMEVAEILVKSKKRSLHNLAISVLGDANLSSEDRKFLIDQVIPKTEGSNVPFLLFLFEEVEGKEVLRSLEARLLQMEEVWQHLSLGQVEKLYLNYPELGQALMDSLKRKQSERLTVLEDVEASLVSGDVDSGRELFYGKATCSTCHTVNSSGRSFGPDLTNIGEIRSRHDLLEAILFPDVSFSREYETSIIKTHNDQFLGIIQEHFDGNYIIDLGPGSKIKLPEEMVVSIETADQSLMPFGMVQQLNAQELSDLMAFLISLPDGIPKI